jgi:hypothetical protein
MISGTGEIHSSGRGHIRDKYVHYCRGHSRDKRDQNRRDYNPFHISSGSEAKIEYKDHINSRGKGRGTDGSRKGLPKGQWGRLRATF